MLTKVPFFQAKLLYGQIQSTVRFVRIDLKFIKHREILVVAKCPEQDEDEVTYKCA